MSATPFCHPVRWGCEVEVFGTKVSPGDLIHADKHGFMVIAPDEQPGLLDATRFMDASECNTVMPVGGYSFAETALGVVVTPKGSVVSGQ